MLGYEVADEIIHRDNFVLMKEIEFIALILIR